MWRRHRDRPADNRTDSAKNMRFTATATRSWPAQELLRRTRRCGSLTGRKAGYLALASLDLGNRPGGGAGWGGRGTPPRVYGCRRLEAGRCTVLDGCRYACASVCLSKKVFGVGLCRLRGGWWRLGVPRPSLGLRSCLRLQREWGRLQCRMVDGFHPAGIDVFPSGDGGQLRLDEQFNAGGPSVEAT